MTDQKTTRTDWAEHEVEEMLSVPLVAEFVLRSPKHNDPSEKEVIDFLIIHKEECILISQKAQDDPTKRSVERNEQWVLKNIQDALKPVCGAIRKPDERPKWCEHPRRGRVELPTLPPIIHGVVLAETRQAVDVSSAATHLPLEYHGVPISYLSINDFLNLVVRLRTVPELMEYLIARRSLPRPSLYIVGDERPLFEIYLMKGGTFKGCLGHADAKRATHTHHELLKEALDRDAEYLLYNSLIEHVANCLAERDPAYEKGLSSDLTQLFDPTTQRKNYLVLQGILTNLRIRERAELGRALHTVSTQTAAKARGLTFQIVHIDGRDHLYILIASKGWQKADLFNAVERLSAAALAYYQKRECLAIIDRDGEHYDLALSRPCYMPTEEDIAAGTKYFGHLRMTDIDLSNL